MILLIDNGGLFTYSLAAQIRKAGANADIRRPLEVDIHSLPGGYNASIITTGPVDDASLKANMELAKAVLGALPVLGIGLGARAVLEALGGSFEQSPLPGVGRAVEIVHDETALFEGIPTPLIGGRYDQMVPVEEALPEDWVVTAHTLDGEVMGVRHAPARSEAILFQPSSVLTPRGADIIANFIEIANDR